ncbi:MAG: sigma-70 family RNA polymerase sigma factor [Candidatus Fimimonas sp.]
MENLVLRAKAGEESAVEEIVAQYKGLIRAVANKFFLVGGDKDDLLQEGMLGLYFAILNFDESKGSFPSFVKLCVMRQLIDAVKKDNSDRNKALANYLDISLAENLPDDRTPLQDLLEKEAAQRVRNIIETQLSALEKQVVELFAEGYSYEDIAEKLGVSYKAVDGALQRARKKLLMFKKK